MSHTTARLKQAPVERIIQDYLRQYPGHSPEQIVEAIEEGFSGYRTYSRRPIYRALGSLKSQYIVMGDKPGKRQKRLFLNNDNHFVKQLNELDQFGPKYEAILIKVFSLLKKAYERLIRFSIGYNYTYTKVYATLSDAEQLWINTLSIIIPLYQINMMSLFAYNITLQDANRIAAFDRVFGLIRETNHIKNEIFELLLSENRHDKDYKFGVQLLRQYGQENTIQLLRQLSRSGAPNSFDIWNFFGQMGLKDEIEGLQKSLEDLTSVLIPKKIFFSRRGADGLEHRYFDVPSFYEDFNARTLQLVIIARNRWLKKKGKPLKSTEIPLEYGHYVDASRLTSYLDAFQKATDFQQFFSQNFVRD